ncbi:unnamed protein product, partial [Musa textilis]
MGLTGGRQETPGPRKKTRRKTNGRTRDRKTPLMKSCGVSRRALFKDRKAFTLSPPEVGD